MQRTGIANLPLHGGKAPRWLFGRMVKLSKEISIALVDEFGQEEFLKRISDPFWFQALGNVLGFDWHSSGVTTTVCGALKESVNKINLGIKVCGGKGRVSRKTISEIENSGISESKIKKLTYASRMSAKVDSALVQDSYQLYQHSFFFSEKGDWCVVQQGMNEKNNYARRYHWLSYNVQSFVNEPHNAICCDSKSDDVLNMTSKESEESRKVSVDLVNDNPAHLRRFFTPQTMLSEFSALTMPRHHPVYISDLKNKTIESLKSAYELQPQNYEELVSLKGIGPKSVRALALVSEIIYGKSPSWKDPAKYSFAHGGKDGFPYPVDRENYDKTILILKTALQNARIGEMEKINAIRRLNNFI